MSVVGVGGLKAIPPIHVDLGFLAELPQLEHLDFFPGVWHAGRGSNPLEPPFEGLPRTLQWLRYDAWDPDTVQPAVRAYLGHEEAVHVGQRYGHEPAKAAWTLHHDGDDGGWHTYGTLADEFDCETENEALKIARQKLAASAPELLSRLDFDQESSGTGITAPRREDLEAALEILGITPTPLGLR